MQNDMRKEFEDYVKKLTTAICKDIFLEDLEELYEKYNKEYERYSQAASLAEEAGKSLADEVGTAAELIKTIDKKTNKSITSVNKEIAQVEKNTDQLFAEMRAFNIQKSEEFVAELAKYIDGYKAQLSLLFEEENRKISDKLAGIITPEILQRFLDSLRENTAETKNLALFIGGKYKEEVEKSIQGIAEANKKAMQVTISCISQYVQKTMGELRISCQGAYDGIDKLRKAYEEANSKNLSEITQYFGRLVVTEKAERTSAMEEQKKLIAQIGPSDEKMNRLEQEVIRLEKAVAKLQRENDTYRQQLEVAVGRLCKKESVFEDRLSTDVEDMKNEIFAVSGKVRVSAGVVAGCGTILLFFSMIGRYGLVGILILAAIVVTIAALSPKVRMAVMQFLNRRNRK